MLSRISMQLSGSVLLRVYIYCLTTHASLKERYLTAYAVVITCEKTELVELRESSIDVACSLLGNPNFDTRMEY